MIGGTQGDQRQQGQMKPGAASWDLIGGLCWVLGTTGALALAWIIAGVFMLWQLQTAGERSYALVLPEASVATNWAAGSDLSGLLLNGTSVVTTYDPRIRQLRVAVLPATTRWWGPFSDNPIKALLSGLLVGGCLALGQIPVMYWRRRHGRWWLGLVVGGCALGWFGASALLAVWSTVSSAVSPSVAVALSAAMSGRTTDGTLLSVHAARYSESPMWLLSAVLAGGLAGLVQWWGWRARTRRAVVWLFASVFGWLVGQGLASVVQSGLINLMPSQPQLIELLSGDPTRIVLHQLAAWAAQGAALGLGVGIVTGLAFAWLARHYQPTVGDVSGSGYKR